MTALAGYRDRKEYYTWPGIAPQKDIVQGINLLDDGKLVNGKLIILGACNVVLGGFQRYVFRNEDQQMLDLRK